MSKKKWFGLLTTILCLGVLGYLGYRYFFPSPVGTTPLSLGQAIFVNPTPPTTADTAATSSTQPLSDQSQLPYTIEPFVTGLEVPWSLVFTSPQRLLVSERPGKIRVVMNGQLAAEPLRTFAEVSHNSEEGLMGMTLDPNYAQNTFIYLCLAYNQGTTIKDKVVRVVDGGSTLSEDQVIIDNIPAASLHAGCRLRFGPDGKLYITTGDALQKDEAQDPTVLSGKVLRLNPDGTIPSDNPSPASPVHSYGHRNPQGLDWHLPSQTLITTEHGPSGMDGPGGGDEVNIIKPGLNYGWPVVSHQKSAPNMVSPALVFTPAIAPASGMFYRSQVIPELTGSYLVGLLRGQGILRVVFDNAPQVVFYEQLPGIKVGRVRDIVEGPDGFIYFTTSNRDGRGQANDGDDQIYRLVPRAL